MLSVRSKASGACEVSRARNQDRSSATIEDLRMKVQELKHELLAFKNLKRLVGEDSTEQYNDIMYENSALKTLNEYYRFRYKTLREDADRLTVTKTQLLTEKTTWEFMCCGDFDTGDGVKALIKGYVKEVEEIKAKLIASEEVCAQLRNQLKRYEARTSMGPNSAVAVSGICDLSCSVDVTIATVVLPGAKRNTKPLPPKGNYEDENREKMKDADVETDKNIGLEGSDSEAELLKGDEQTFRDLATGTRYAFIEQKMIGEIKKCQCRKEVMRQQYVKRLIHLQQKKTEIEIEKNLIVSKMSPARASKNMDEKVRKIERDFEQKLKHFHGELKKMCSVTREHAMLTKKQTEYRRQAYKLKQELEDMKKSKEALVSKMKEESRRHQEAGKRCNQQMAQILKKSRWQDDRIRSLEAQDRALETSLKRLHEERVALERQARASSQGFAVRVPKQNPAPRKGLISPKVAKKSWQTIEKHINQLVLTKQSVYTLQRDMERSLSEREKLTLCLERTMRKRERVVQAGKDTRNLDSEVASIKANLNYQNENIRECQVNLLQVEKKIDGRDCPQLDAVLEGLVDTQGRYLLEKLLHKVINHSLQAALNKSKVEELKARLELVEARKRCQKTKPVAAHQEAGASETLAIATLVGGAGERDQLKSSSLTDKSSDYESQRIP
nr:kinesin-like protein KIF21B [Rhipicephalus microplus]